MRFYRSLLSPWGSLLFPATQHSEVAVIPIDLQMVLGRTCISNEGCAAERIPKPSAAAQHQPGKPQLRGDGEKPLLTHKLFSLYTFQAISQITELCHMNTIWVYGRQLLTCASSKIFFTCLMASVTSWLGGSMRELLAPKEKPPYLGVQMENEAHIWLHTSRKHHFFFPRCLLFLHYNQGTCPHSYIKGKLWPFHFAT